MFDDYSLGTTTIHGLEISYTALKPRGGKEREVVKDRWEMAGRFTRVYIYTNNVKLPMYSTSWDHEKADTRFNQLHQRPLTLGPKNSRCCNVW